MYVTLTGTNFSPDMTPTVALAFVKCLTTSWSTGTAVRCTQPEPPATALGARVSFQYYIFGAVASSQAKYSFNAPVVSSAQRNAPHTGALGSSVRLTVTGLSFGSELHEYTPTAAVSDVACSTTSWTSKTSLTCAPKGYGGSDGYPGFVQVCVSGQHGTGQVFSFDASVISLIYMNGPITGGPSITAGGLNFGASEYTSSGHLSGGDCQTTSWTSPTQVICASGYGANLDCQSPFSPSFCFTIPCICPSFVMLFFSRGCLLKLLKTIGRCVRKCSDGHTRLRASYHRKLSWNWKGIVQLRCRSGLRRSAKRCSYGNIVTDIIGAQLWRPEYDRVHL